VGSSSHCTLTRKICDKWLVRMCVTSCKYHTCSVWVGIRICAFSAVQNLPRPYSYSADKVVHQRIISWTSYNFKMAVFWDIRVMFMSMGWDDVSELQPPSDLLFISQYGATVVWYWQGKAEEVGQTSVLVPTIDPTRTDPAVRGRRLAAWAMAWPCSLVESRRRFGGAYCLQH
jgi:hypothetical protein